METTLRIEPDLLASLDAEVRSGNLDAALGRVYQLCHRLASQSPQFTMRYNHLPELDRLVQTVGRTVTDGIGLRATSESTPGGLNVFVATELYLVGGHTRMLADLTRNSRKPNLVILTDVFGGYARGELRIGPIAEWIDAAILVLPDMSLLDKTRNLLRLLTALDVNAIGILAHHQDVVAYAACNDRVPDQQIFLHHADYNPTLGATVKHYRHIDLMRGDQRMCQVAGYVDDPLYMPMFAARNFQQAPALPGFNTATAGSFAKFATQGKLDYADIVVAILDSIDGNHVHIGDIPPEYLGLIRDRVAASGIEPDRFVYLGAVQDLQQALIAHQVGVYISSAPVGSGKAYTEVLGLGVAILIYAEDESAISDVPIAAFHAESAYDPAHRRWSNIRELCAHLRSLDLSEEFVQSQRAFSALYPDGEFARLTQSYF